MANILLTDSCVRACPYCFAGAEMARHDAGPMAWDDIVYVADFLQASGERRVSLLGGEPTLHPDFPAVLGYFVARGFDVTVFTSGLMSSVRLNALAAEVPQYPKWRVQFVCNINNPAQTPETPAETAKRDAFLEALGPWTQAGFNIYRTDFDLMFLFDLIERFKLRRYLRLGIAHPIPDAGNLSIAIADMRTVIARLGLWREAFEKLRVRPSLDCGFPLCKISDEELGWMSRLTGPINFKCDPAIDITPDLQVYSCFPLAGIERKSLYDFDSYSMIVDYFRFLMLRIRAKRAGLFDECGACPRRADGVCSGGGACQIVTAMSSADRSALMVST
jgi:cyclic pyranopterin phosphate synthase